MLTFENRWTLFLLVFLAVASSAAFYFLQMQSASKHRPNGHYPDSIGYQLTLKRYDTHGLLAQIIFADISTHYPDTKTTEFQKLHMLVMNPDNTPPWNIFAPFAIAYPGGSPLNILGPVHMTQAASNGHGPSFLDTQNVTILSDKKILFTKEPVYGKQDGLKVQAVGAVYDYANDVLKLQSGVQVLSQPKEVKK